MRQNFRCIHCYFCFLFAMPTWYLFYKKSKNRAWLLLKCCFQHLWDYSTFTWLVFSSFYSTTGLKIILFIIFNKKLSSVVFNLCICGINGLVLLMNVLLWLNFFFNFTGPTSWWLISICRCKSSKVSLSWSWMMTAYWGWVQPT